MTFDELTERIGPVDDVTIIVDGGGGRTTSTHVTTKQLATGDPRTILQYHAGGVVNSFALGSFDPNRERIDRDMPGDGDAYVIRIEAADGRRLKVIVTDSELEAVDTAGRYRLLEAKASALVTPLLMGQGHIKPGMLRMDDGLLVEVEPPT